MSEYWISKKKYFCKYCEIYITDDAPSRQQHEGGLRHKGNLERFIRGLYKVSEKRKKDLEEEKRDMARVELAAQAAFAQDVAAGHARAARTASEAGPSSTAYRKAATKQSNPYANYSTAESLGYQDPDAERLAAEMERRRTQGIAGEWEVVTSAASSTIEPSLPEEKEMPSSPAETVIKRPRDAAWDEEDGYLFKLRKKTLNRGLGEVYDPGIIQIKKTELKATTKLLETQTSETDASPGQTPSSNGLKWTKLSWKPADTAEEGAHNSVTVQSKEEAAVKEEESRPSEVLVARTEEASDHGAVVKSESASVMLEESAGCFAVKAEDDNSTSSLNAITGGLFRKRKLPAARAQGRR